MFVLCSEGKCSVRAVVREIGVSVTQTGLPARGRHEPTTNSAEQGYGDDVAESMLLSELVTNTRLIKYHRSMKNK